MSDNNIASSDLHEVPVVLLGGDQNVAMDQCVDSELVKGDGDAVGDGSRQVESTSENNFSKVPLQTTTADSQTAVTPARRVEVVGDNNDTENKTNKSGSGSTSASYYAREGNRDGYSRQRPIDDDDDEDDDDDDDEEEDEGNDDGAIEEDNGNGKGALRSFFGLVGSDDSHSGNNASNHKKQKKGSKRSKFAKALLLKPCHEKSTVGAASGPASGAAARHGINTDSDAWGDDAAQPLADGAITVDMGGVAERDSGDLRSNRKKPKNAFQRFLCPFHEFFMLLPVQSLMFLLLLVDLTFLIYEFVADDNDNAWGTTITMATSSTFVLELLVHLGYLGSDFFFFDKKWQFAEVTIVSMSFIVELTVFLLPKDSDFVSRIRYLRIVRAFRILILWKTRFRHFRTSLRQLVSADRRRYQKNGFDLDLTYVETNIIAMSWPSESMESIYRNHIDNVSRFMDETHPNAYWIYNLCSERRYDERKFHNRVTRYRLDDHNPGELWSMFCCAQDVTLFLGKDPSNIVAIHCKGGKGRTGTMTCAYLLYSRRQTDADSAMTHFGRMRTSDDARSFQGVESPSQARYLRYFDRLINTIDEKQIMRKGIPTRNVRITKLVLRNVPAFFLTKGLDRLWFTVITSPSSERVVEYISNPTVSFTAEVPLKKKYNKTYGNETSTNTSNLSPSQPAATADTKPKNTNTYEPLASPSSRRNTSAVNGSESPTESQLSPHSLRKMRAQSAMSIGGSGMSRSRAQSNVDGTTDGGCQPFGANMVAFIDGNDEKPLDCETATKYFKTFSGAKGTNGSPHGQSSSVNFDNSAASASALSGGGPMVPRVDVAFSTTGIPSVSGDTIIKFFYNEDLPDPLHPPLQFWFHPYFERKRMVLGKLELDGPHKEGLTKQKKWSNAVCIEMEMEDCSSA